MRLAEGSLWARYAGTIIQPCRHSLLAPLASFIKLNLNTVCTLLPPLLGASRVCFQERVENSGCCPDFIAAQISGGWLHSSSPVHLLCSFRVS
ncbi:hypothetical protein BDZ97DRAFT_1833924 [Flammula alnicola]|nr:hypothetical protein BDZ97DRAFT_1833924 [Flammula alnicola]